MTQERPVEILIVEDNPNDLELALHALSKHHLGNRIEVARDGVEALEFIEHTLRRGEREKIPRVILLDLKLPKLDGLEVLRRLKADVRTRSIPVIVMTSSQQERDLVKSYELGANSYVVKPVDFEQFTNAVRAMGFYWLLLNRAPEPRMP